MPGRRPRMLVKGAGLYEISTGFCRRRSWSRTVGRSGANWVLCRGVVILPNRSHTTCTRGVRRAKSLKSPSLDQMIAPVRRARATIRLSGAARSPRSFTWSDG